MTSRESVRDALTAFRVADNPSHNVTWLLPTNEALQRYIAAHPSVTHLSLSSSPETEEAILTHRINQAMDAATLPPGKHCFRSAASNVPVYVDKVDTDGGITLTSGVDTAKYLGCFQSGSNYFWIIDDVLSPLPLATSPQQQSAGSASANDLSFAIEAFKRAGLDLAALGACTCFVPHTGALSAYAVVDPTASDALGGEAGVQAIRSHIIPGLSLCLSSLSDGMTHHTSLAGTTLMVTKSGLHLSVSSGTGQACDVTGGVQHGRAQLFTIDGILAPVTPDPSRFQAVAAAPSESA